MTQEDRWQNNYDEVMRLVNTNRRNLSKYEMTERRLYISNAAIEIIEFLNIFVWEDP